MTLLKAFAAANLLALHALVAGHGNPSMVTAEGVAYEASVPSYGGVKTVPMDNQTVWEVGPIKQWGIFLTKDKVNSADIICNVNGRPVPTNTRVAAGNNVAIEWKYWPEVHQGPVLAYMANCGGPCQDADKTKLKFFKVFESTMLEDSKSPVNGQWLPGKWGTDALYDNGNVVNVKVPMVKPDNYLMRIEIIALHQATSVGPQFYPYCINLDVTGSGTLSPSGILGTDLYSMDDEGINANVYVPLGNYSVGPPMFDSDASASVDSAPSSPSPASTGSTDASESPESSDSTDSADSTGSTDSSESPEPSDSAPSASPTPPSMEDSSDSTGSEYAADAGTADTDADAAAASPSPSPSKAKKSPRRACKAYYD
ncbi:MAG: hypothetical protein M1815_005331 [Lichina confinis]|nr:MAG: hypothetical protein M1815_005331 [Lichina confinis]